MAVVGCAPSHAAPLVSATLSTASPASPPVVPTVDAQASYVDGATGAPALSPLPATVIETAPPEMRIETANATARVEPSGLDYDQSAQLYSFAPHALYQVYAAPGRVTDIALQPGERLSGEGAIAAGDTARWIIGESVSGIGETARTHILVKPTRPDLSTNLVIHTERRTYLLELQARPDVYMAAIAWRYPHEEALALDRAQAEERARDREPRFDPAALNFDYRIEGHAAPWRPVHVFDDGRRVFISFGPAVDQTRLPPLFVAGDTGEVALINYRIEAGRMVVDRLFDRAELRLVEGRRDQVVRIVRTGDRS